MPDIKHLLVINSPASKVFKAVTETKGLMGWWTAGASAEPTLNSTAVFNFGDSFHNEMKVVELVPGKMVRWLCEKGDKEWIGTTIIFTLKENEDKTTLTFEHNGWENTTDFFASCNYNWGWYMTSLKDYCEKGKGRPFPESLKE
jgi:uncharacterized protein YndB with AHSA1/START domain